MRGGLPITRPDLLDTFEVSWGLPMFTDAFVQFERKSIVYQSVQRLVASRRDAGICIVANEAA
jgi:hypothetical protein